MNACGTTHAASAGAVRPASAGRDITGRTWPGGPSEILVAVRVGVSLGVGVIVGVPREAVLVPVLFRPVRRAAAAEARVLPLRPGDVQAG